MLSEFFGPAPSVRASRISWAAGTTLLVIAGVLIYAHGAALRDLQERTLPAALQLPALERRLASLRAQVELTELHAALQTGSIDEIILTRIIPPNPELASLLETIDLLTATGIAEGSIYTVGGIDVSDPQPVE